MLRPDAAGAREARFEALVRAVAEPLHRYLVRRTDPDAVDDILADTMLVLWRRLDDVPGLGDAASVDPDEVLPWCYGVAAGCLANSRRAHARRLRLLERLIRTRPSFPATGDTDFPDLHAALGTLNTLDREVVQLWAWEELTPGEIGQATGLTANAVSIRLHRAKKKIATLLERKTGGAAGQETGKGRSNR